jgi:transposase InsO family protein
MPTDSFGQKKYFVSLIDDFSRCCHVYFIRHKSEVLDKFKEFEALVTNETGQSIGTLRTDNDGEYVSKDFEEFLKSKGIRHEL